MKYNFSKYQGTGNDFIIFDRKKYAANLTSAQINLICDRRFGIGGDGVIFLEGSENSDFKMLYYNADGQEGSMCGNGGRCIVHYAFQQQYIKRETSFEAVDGLHKASVNAETPGQISLLMRAVESIEIADDFVFLNTGSPHYVKFVLNADEIDVVAEGRKIRYNERFNKLGTNVNFVEIRNDELYVRTYERGVEDETLSCGTGVTAAVLAAAATNKVANNNRIRVSTPGGMLDVEFVKNGNGYSAIYLTGPAVCVFEGEINL